MKIDIDSDGQLTVEEVYNSITLISASKESFAICMRDSGFEFFYCGRWYEAKEGKVRLQGAELNAS